VDKEKEEEEEEEDSRDHASCWKQITVPKQYVNWMFKSLD